MNTLRGDFFYEPVRTNTFRGDFFYEPVRMNSLREDLLYEPVYMDTLRGDFPYADDTAVTDNSFVLHDNARLNLSRPKSVSECVHFSNSCSGIAETTFTVPVEINKVDLDQPTCSSTSHPRPHSLSPSQPLPEMSSKPKPTRRDSDVLCLSERSDLTPTEDTYFYTDCQALFNTSSATEDDIFYSQLEELTLSTLSLSEELPAEAEEPNQTFCCDIFSPTIKEETNSVLAKELEEDQTVAELEPAASVPTSQVQNHFTDCFPI